MKEEIDPWSGTDRSTTPTDGYSKSTKSAIKPEEPRMSTKDINTNVLNAFCDASKKIYDPSIMSVSSSKPIVANIFNELVAATDRFKSASISDDKKKKLIPGVYNLSHSLSDVLPGILLRKEVNECVTAIMIVFMYSAVDDNCPRHTIPYESIYSNLRQSVEVTKTPVECIGKELISEIIHNEKKNIDGKDGSIATILAMIVNINSYAESEDHSVAQAIASSILSEWETAYMLHVNSAMVMAQNDDVKYEVTQSFIAHPAREKNKDTGILVEVKKNVSLVANHVPLRDRNNGCVTPNYIPSPATTAITLNQLKPNDGHPITTYVDVNLYGNTYRYTDDTRADYKPIYPVINLTFVKDNRRNAPINPLASFLMGIYATLSYSRDNLWVEGVAAIHKDSHRGTLVDVERMIDDITENYRPYGYTRYDDLIATKDKLNDPSFTRNWFANNCASDAAISVDLFRVGNDGALSDLLLKTNDPDLKFRSREIVINMIDLMTQGAFSKVCESTGKWSIKDQIFINYGHIVPMGTYSHNGVLRSLAELDLTHLYYRFPDDIDRAIECAHALNTSDHSLPQRYHTITSTLKEMFNDNVSITGFTDRLIINNNFLFCLEEALYRVYPLTIEQNRYGFASQRSPYGRVVGNTVRHLHDRNNSVYRGAASSPYSLF